MIRLGLALLAAAFLAAAPAAAQTVLTIGVRSEAASLDPHWTQLSADLQVQEHIFEHLVDLDPASQPVPGLAVSWQPLDATTWEFRLRPGVTWHDGAPFTADDVIFSFDRLAAGIAGAPASPAFTLAKGGKRWVKIDDLTVHVLTNGPYPTVAEDLAMVPIVAAHVARGVTPSVDFNSGKAAVGTGPFMFEEFSPGNRISVVRNPNWWGGDPGWDRVVFRPVGQDAARLAALLNGDVDIIDYPPTVDLPQLEANPDFRVSTIPSDRLIYVILGNKSREPFVTDNAGNVLFPSPLRDWRVRKAMSLAIDRNAIRDRIMGGASEPTRNIVPPGFFGYVDDLQPDAFNPDEARRLLAAAGYPDGFRVTFQGPNDRYINDARIVETIAQMWTRVGIRTEVDTMPRNIFFSELIRGGPETFPGFDMPKFSVALTGWGTVAGEATYTVSGILETYNAATGGGNGNFGRYSNVLIDALSIRAKQTIDRTERLALLQQATRLGMEDYAFIPIHFQVNKWAMKASLEHTPRTNERTLAWEVRRVR